VFAGRSNRKPSRWFAIGAKNLNPQVLVDLQLAEQADNKTKEGAT